MADLIYGGPQVKREPLRTTPRRALLMPGRAIEKTGYQITRAGKIWEKMLEDHERNKQELEVNSKLSEMMFEWSSQHRPALMTRTGENAVGTTLAAREQLNKMKTDNSTGLSPWASDLMTRRWGNFTDAALRGIASNEATQQALASETKKQELGNHWLEQIAADPTDVTFDAAVKGMGDILISDLLEGEAIGDFPLKVKAMRLYKEAAAVTLIGALIDRGNIREAERWLTVYSTAPGEKQNAVLGNDAQKALKGLLKAKNTEIVGDTNLVGDQDYTDGLMNRARQDDMSLGEMQELVRKENSGEAEERRVRLATNRYKAVKEFEAAQDVAAIEAGHARVREIVPPGPGPMTAEMETAIAEVRKTIPGKFLDAFDQYVIRQLRSDPVTAATTAKMDEWNLMSAEIKLSMTHEYFKARYLYTLNNDDYDLAERQFFELRNVKSSMTAVTWDQRKNDLVTSVVGIDNEPETKRRRKELTRALDDEFDRRQGVEERPLTSVEQALIISDWSIVGIIPGAWGGSDKPFAKWLRGDTEMSMAQAFAEGEVTRAQWILPEVDEFLAGDSDASRDARMYIGVLEDVYRETYHREPPPEFVELEVLRMRQGGSTANIPEFDFPTEHPMVINPDGSRSNVRLMSVTFTGDDGKDFTLAIPTMVGGVQLSDEDAVAEAKLHGLRRYPAFHTVEEAEAWIKDNHGNTR